MSFSAVPRDVYSLNVPVPGEVSALASSLAREIPAARARPRDKHTLVVKRLGGAGHDAFARLAARARETLTGTPAFEARIAGVDYFPRAAAGPSPVVYLAVESPGLVALHHRLCEAFDPVEDVEGDAYVPHVTVARGGAVEAAELSVDPVEWTVTELAFRDAERGQSAGTVSLPA